MHPTLFNSMQLSEELLNAINDMDYTEMTQIQSQAIPYILEGKDVIGRSNTGTGKTAAFGIPAVEMTWELPTNRPRILILAPTRELAVQISEELKKYAKYKSNVSIATVYGGQSMELQIRQLKSANIVVGTPGRIMDHMRRKTLKLEKLKMVILDEADEMLNMGFYDDIKLILSESPEERQTVLFSATMPPAIMKITEEFQNDPVLVTVQNEQRTVPKIKQAYYIIPQNKKADALKLLISMQKPNRSLIFCNTKMMVDDLVERLCDDGYKCIGLHGDMKQSQRNKVMQDYKSGKIEILIATDVAARGIDVTDIDAVYNFDIPQETEYYIHRIGRTGRAGKEGAAYTLIGNKIQLRKMMDIQRMTKAVVSEEFLPNAEEIKKSNQEQFTTKILDKINDQSCVNQYAIIDRLVETGAQERDIAAVLLSMLIDKDKTILPEVKEVVVPKERTTQSRSERFGSNLSTGSRTKLKVNIGRNVGIAPNFIVGAIVESTGMSSKCIGKIDIFTDFTTIEMLEEDAQRVMDTMQNSKIKNQRVQFTVMEKGISSSSTAPKRKYQGQQTKSHHTGTYAKTGSARKYSDSGSDKNFDRPKKYGGRKIKTY